MGNVGDRFIAALTSVALAAILTVTFLPLEATLSPEAASAWLRSTAPRPGRAAGLRRRGRILATRLTSLYLNTVGLGERSPRRGEVIDVDPSRIAGKLSPAMLRRLRLETGRSGGVVVGGHWDREVQYLDFSKKLVYRACQARWVEGRPWEETELFQIYRGRLERGERCRFASYRELVDRYRALDAIYAQVRREGRLSDLPEHLVRISIVRDGRLLWGPNGRHRVSIALVAGLPTMPASVGFVHTQAVDAFGALRRTSRHAGPPGDRPLAS
jgi:hypothetical protein